MPTSRPRPRRRWPRGSASSCALAKAMRCAKRGGRSRRCRPSSTLRCPASIADPARFSVAYEPIWAIGTGKVPSTAEIGEMHAALRARLKAAYGEAGDEVRILYGGSVKASNAAEIFGVADVDGALVGGASLKAADFLPIVEAASACAEWISCSLADQATGAKENPFFSKGKVEMRHLYCFCFRVAGACRAASRPLPRPVRVRRRHPGYRRQWRPGRHGHRRQWRCRHGQDRQARNQSVQGELCPSKMASC